MNSKKAGRLSPWSTTRIEMVAFVLSAARVVWAKNSTALASNANPADKMKFWPTP